MIGTIADDFTGAAEIGAVGWRHGLRSEVVLAGKPSSDSDLVCLDTDSRSCLPDEAAHRAASAARLLRQQQTDWIYKKTDSILRGNVTPELEAIVTELGLDGTLLVPANPTLGRTIEGGRYFVRGQLIHETEFARDPKHPRSSPSARELIAMPSTLPLLVRRVEEGLPERGIVIGEAARFDDLRQWATLRNARWLMAGGAEFFGALLDLPVACSPPPLAEARELFVCGSASEVTRSFVARQEAQGVRVFSLPPELASGSEVTAIPFNRLADQVVAAFQMEPHVVLYVGRPPVKEDSTVETLAVQLVRLAAHVIPRAQVGQVFAEGGATAVALARQMGWQRLRVLAELAPGVVSLSVGKEAPTLTIKPGSYDWPGNTFHARTG